MKNNNIIEIAKMIGIGIVSVPVIALSAATVGVMSISSGIVDTTETLIDGTKKLIVRERTLYNKICNNISEEEESI